jgi:phosphoribosylanthranilate isomerase
MVKVKICGITNLEDALASLFAGADAVGFVFYKKSPRYIDPRKAGNISRILPAGIKRVGVFVDAPASRVKKIAALCRLDMLQFHGGESAAYCRRFRGYKVIKAFPVAAGVDARNLREFPGCLPLFDSCSGGRFGGTGKKFNWKLLKNAGKIKRPFFLSGGLDAGNVRAAIKMLKPDWVDVSSGVEKSAGRKDHGKVRGFIKRARKPEGARL